MNMFETIRIRRAIRKYTSQPVEEEKLLQVLEASRLAPTWANKQCCKVIVIRSQETKEALSEISNVPGSGYPLNPARKSLVSAPIVLVICADPELSGNMYGKEYYLVDVGIVMDHIMLTAASLGLGTCFVGVFDEEKVKRLLDVPANIRVVGITPLGYPERWPDARPRKVLNELVAYEKWAEQPYA